LKRDVDLHVQVQLSEKTSSYPSKHQAVGVSYTSSPSSAKHPLS